MKTIVFIMPRLPFPTVSGRKTSLFHYCRILHEMGYRLIVISFLEAGDNPILQPDFIDRLEVLPKIPGKTKLFNLVKYSFLLHKWPMQVSLFWSNNAKIIVDKVIEEEKPVAVLSDMVRTTEYLKNQKIYKIADLDDMISLRYQRQLDYNIDIINPYGAYLETLPKILQTILMMRAIRRLVVKEEIKLLKKYEQSIALDFDKTIFVAHREVDLMNENIGKIKCVAVPIGVDYSYFSEQLCINEFESKYICFLGQMSVAHNESAVIYFIENIFPIIRKTIPDAIFMIVGGGVTDTLWKYECSNVIITGRVNDVREYLQKCRVFVCPLAFGSGIKTKNLEAMASRIPVVTTEIGAENIEAESGIHWYIAKNDEEFSKDVVRLMCDDSEYERIRNNGQEYVKNNWTWEAASNAFKSILP